MIKSRWYSSQWTVTKVGLWPWTRTLRSPTWSTACKRSVESPLSLSNKMTAETRVTSSFLRSKSQALIRCWGSWSRNHSPGASSLKPLNRSHRSTTRWIGSSLVVWKRTYRPSSKRLPKTSQNSYSQSRTERKQPLHKVVKGSSTRACRKLSNTCSSRDFCLQLRMHRARLHHQPSHPANTRTSSVASLSKSRSLPCPLRKQELQHSSTRAAYLISKRKPIWSWLSRQAMTMQRVRSSRVPQCCLLRLLQLRRLRNQMRANRVSKATTLSSKSPCSSIKSST